MIQILKMGPKNFDLFFLFLFSFTILEKISPSSSSSQLTNFIYKGCANQKSQDPTGLFSQNLNTLFDNLILQSLTTKFYNYSSGSGISAISGLFQCRGDLSNQECNTCVKKTPKMSQEMCGGDSIAARIQLNGCYLRYQVVGFQTVGPTELLFKICGKNGNFQFNDAFDEMIKGVNGNGFYVGGYKSVYVLGQCEGDLSNGECVNCVKNAVGRAKSECGGAISGQIYLQECYISYNYYPNGVPSQSLSPSGTRQSTQKIVAIVFGGLVGVGLVVACLLVTKSAFKKKSYSKYGG